MLPGGQVDTVISSADLLVIFHYSPFFSSLVASQTVTQRTDRGLLGPTSPESRKIVDDRNLWDSKYDNLHGFEHVSRRRSGDGIRGDPLLRLPAASRQHD